MAASSVLTEQHIVYHQHIADLNKPIRLLAETDQESDAHSGWRIK